MKPDFDMKLHFIILNFSDGKTIEQGMVALPKFAITTDVIHNCHTRLKLSNNHYLTSTVYLGVMTPEEFSGVPEVEANTDQPTSKKDYTIN